MEFQHSLFNEGGDLNTAPLVEDQTPTEKPLSRQCLAMLELLQFGPCTNLDFLAITTRVDRQLRELRKRGYIIEPDHALSGSRIVTFTLRGKK